MREIKFRALDENREWIYGMPLTYVEYEEKEFPLMRNCDETGYWGIKKIQPKTLGQYTGLKDKNGVEIYEGDILYFEPYGTHGNDRIVEYKDGTYRGRLIRNGYSVLLIDCVYGTKVIGNIYENPELLEREAE